MRLPLGEGPREERGEEAGRGEDGEARGDGGGAGGVGQGGARQPHHLQEGLNYSRNMKKCYD